MKKRFIKNGSKNDDWETPKYILDLIKETYGKFFDPCPLNPKFNGLDIKWKKVNFVNPPYNNALKVAFIEKAYEEYLKGKTSIVLIPSSTDIPIFHDIILKHCSIFFTRGRIKFKGNNSKGKYVDNKTGQTGSIFCIFDPNNKKKVISSFEINELRTIKVRFR